MFAEEIYQAKINAHVNNLSQIEVLCDLLIGYTYINMGAYEKASSIIYKIIKSSKEQGMFIIEHLGWYFLSEMNLRRKNFDIAYGMLNNSIIQLEKMGKVSDYIIMLFKYNMFKIMMYKGSYDKAQICINQSAYIAQRYGINIEFDVKPENYYVESEEESEISTENITEEDIEEREE